MLYQKELVRAKKSENTVTMINKVVMKHTRFYFEFTVFFSQAFMFSLLLPNTSAAPG